ncbi:NrfD/PsrC family molybdoenzyme membrane anchor subunit [Fundidesulfovibrio agrisoli]|uniref:NrfD/PsrC family molybdoenzyme membrane anchor subunit n=1 Tax=Fundidesulfovibrio agrisoli TaxID=2922717 RepID=UPI001FAB3E7B|nr:NrfD/PsrC family molybdoenzyme membrane anchor subunit [Fundidesulfovibrio agrisoli]
MSTLIELTAFRHQPVWEMQAALYLLMIQAGAWAMLSGLAAQATGAERQRGLGAWGLLAATGLGLSAPLNLIAEMLGPHKFYTLIPRFNLSSPLSWGVAAISLFVLAGALGCVGLRRPLPVPRKAVAGLGLLAALSVLAYTWFEIARAAGVPLWADPYASAVLLASALPCGLGLALWLDMAHGGAAAQSLMARLVAALGALGAGGTLAVWGLLGSWPGTPGWPWGSALLAGSALALLLAGALFLDRPKSLSGSLLWACLLALAGGLGARLGILLLGQSAALGRAQGEPHMLGHADILGVLATPALFVALMFIASIIMGRPAKKEPAAPEVSAASAAPPAQPEAPADAQTAHGDPA